MRTIIKKYDLKLVKEQDIKFNGLMKLVKPEDAYEIMESVYNMSLKTEEEFVMMTLDVKNNITGLCVVSKGSLNSSTVHPREVFKRAILLNAYSIILFHNHPSGDTEPSKDDICLTNRLVESGKIIGIQVVDHLVIGDQGYKSLRKEGYM